MGKLSPNIAFKDSVEALKYYETVFKATNITRVPLSAEAAKAMGIDPKDAAKKTMHASFTIDGNLILCYDKIDGKYNEWGELGDVMVLTLDYDADDKKEVSKMKELYANISKDKDTKIQLPLGPQPWGGEMGKFKDKYGVIWVLHSMSYKSFH